MTKEHDSYEKRYGSSEYSRASVVGICLAAILLIGLGALIFWDVFHL